uniref:Uncharacterized protein n=1 Tax=Monodon monoceros TaxID=40151 RepID=A0A8C6BTF9_MONMO
APVSRISFFFFFNSVLILDSFILKWWTTTAADLNLRYISSNSTFSCNVMTFFCFLGTPPASLVVLCMGPMVLFKLILCIHDLILFLFVYISLD